MKQSYKIVADSSCDTPMLEGVPFGVAPLRIITAEKEYTDDATLDVSQMVAELKTYKGRSSTSCPNAEDWLTVFGEAERVFCVTITGTLSGSYNAACMAKDLYESQHPERRVFVLNSLTAGPEIALLLERLRELILQGLDYEEIVCEITRYQRQTGLLFVLESLTNLANNGRVGALTAKMAGVLGIRLIGRASDQGDLEPLHKCRGELKARTTLVEQLEQEGFNGGKVRIAHCFNEKAAQELERCIVSAFDTAEVEVYPCRGLCSFYAEWGGMLVGFEKEV